jgi:hypothetical protein
MVLKLMGSNRWLVELWRSIERLLEGEPWSAMNKSNSNTKGKSPLKGKPWGPRGANAIRVPKNELDTADFLIDGLTSGRA